MLLVLLLTVLLSVAATHESCAEYIIVERWGGGWKGKLNIPIPKDTINWKIEATFDNPIYAGDFWAGQKSWSSDKLSVQVLGNDWSAKQDAGNVFKLGFTVNYNQHGPDVNFSILDITLCWADGSGCSTCSVLDEECTGAFAATEEGDTTRSGVIRIMPAQCYPTMPNITLSFSDTVFSPSITLPAAYTAACSGDTCIVSSERALEVNVLLEIEVEVPAGVLVLGVMFDGEDLCAVEPELFEEPTLAPTLEPGPTEEASPTEESDADFPNGCARYEVDSTWLSGWKGLLHIPIKKDTLRWRIDAEFNKPVQNADFWAGLPEIWNPAKTSVTILGKDWSATHKAGTVFHTGFTANHGEGDTVYIKKMRLKLCWADNRACTECDIVKEPCSTGLLLSNTGDPSKVSGILSTTTTSCQNDMSDITLQFDRPVKRLIVPRGRYSAECSERVCVVSTVKPIMMKTGDRLSIKTTVVFYQEVGSLVGLKYGSEDICHRK